MTIKNRAMIGTSVSHYSAFQNPANERNPRKRDKILEKLGGGGMSQISPRIPRSEMSGWKFEDLPLSGIPPYGGILSSGTAFLLREVPR